MIRTIYRVASETFLCPKRAFSSNINFTKNNYEISRGDYNMVDENHMNFFQDILGEERILTDLSDLEKYNVDYFEHLRGNSSIVLKPKTTEEVSRIIGYCNAHRLAVCPQGGNTSVVGGSVPVFDEIIVSTELMDAIENVDLTSGIMVCQSGCILENLDKYLEKKGLLIPIDLAAKRNSHIGGHIATNTGGIRLLRNGNLHANVLGIEAVKANGEIIDCLSSLRESSRGFHLKHIFIGSEGTLGFITKVAIQCLTKPSSVNLAFLGLQKFDKVLKTFHQAKQELGEIVSAVEIMDFASMCMVNQHLGLTSPIGDYPFYLMIETSGSNEKHNIEKLNTFIDSTLKTHLVLNGLVTMDHSKYRNIWSIRERISECFSKDGHVFNFVISLPLENYYVLVSEMKTYMGPRAHRVAGYGHLGDGNLHLAISVDEFSPKLKDYIESYLFKRVDELNGSISPELGMGFLKANYLQMIYPVSAIRVMRDLKNVMDPRGILNPYKLYPENI